MIGVRFARPATVPNRSFVLRLFRNERRWPIQTVEIVSDGRSEQEWKSHLLLVQQQEANVPCGAPHAAEAGATAWRGNISDEKPSRKCYCTRQFPFRRMLPRRKTGQGSLPGNYPGRYLKGSYVGVKGRMSNFLDYSVIFSSRQTILCEKSFYFLLYNIP